MEIIQKIIEKPSLLQRVSGKQIIPNHVFDCIDEKRKDAYINHIVMDMAIEMKKKGLIHIEEEDTVDGVTISAKMFVVSPEAYTLEMKEVDLEKELQNHIRECLDIKFPTTDIELIKKDVEYTARKFFELGLKTQKGGEK
ncbi:MAG: hypothetical protein K6A41_04140 [Bacteroidales bacterium]|nr:hypothetical protein [Bacteroidales bacterium]